MSCKNCTPKFPFLKTFFLTLIVAFSLFAKGQVAVNVTGEANTTPALAASYTSLANAITALQGITSISGPVTLTCAAGTETAPAGGYVINFTAATSSINNVVITGTATTTITANASPTAGALNDAIFKIIGSDFVTIQNFTMQENGNSTFTAASNNMTEWGVALLYASTTNGAQNCTIQNNTISLNRLYQNSFGIYSNSMHAATTPTTGATATTAAGGNSGLVIYTNAISNVNIGIVVIGPTAAADHNIGVDIGGTTVGQGNTITNYGNTGTFSAFQGVSGTIFGIAVRNSKTVNVSYNTIRTATGNNAPSTSTTRGIYIQAASNLVTGTHTITTNNNTISIANRTAGAALQAIFHESLSAGVSATVNMNNNQIDSIYHFVASPTAATTVLNITGSATNGPLNLNVNGNVFGTSTGVMTSPSTGSFTFISHSFTLPANAVVNINNNSIGHSFNKTGAGGTLSFTSTGSSSPNSASLTQTNNNFSNITVTGATTITGFNNTDGAGTSPSKTITGNTFNNITGGTSTVNMMNYTYWGLGTTNTISNNTLTNITGQGAVTGITLGNTVNGTNTITCANNTITGLSSTGTGGTVTGINCTNTTPVNMNGNTIGSLSTTGTTLNGITVSGAGNNSIFSNKLYSLSSSNTSGVVTGINATNGTTNSIYNNLIGNLTAPSSSSLNAAIGINISGGTTVNVSFNSIYLNATSVGANFGTSGILFSTTPTTVLRNNLIFNSSTANGTGLTASLRRTSGTGATVPSNYSTSSNNNLFYSGTPSATNLIYTEGTGTITNSLQTLANYKAFMTSRDASSITENVTFQSTTGTSTDFLKYDLATATQAESGGLTGSGITTDFAGTTRSVTTPDIGAWELVGTAADLTGPSISYTTLSNTACTTAPSLTATITDGSSVNTSPGTKPRLYYKKSGDANTYVGNTSGDNGWKYVEATNSSSPFSFTMNFSLLQSAASAGDVIQYFVTAQDLATTPNVAINSGIFNTTPASVDLIAAAFPITGTINSYTILTGLGTNVTIGAAGTYPTLTGVGGLFEALNAGGITANITASIIDASIAEPGATALNQIAYGCGGPFTLTIKPDVGVTATLTGSVASGALIKLNGADNVVIDGSNNGSSSRDLTITNTATTASTTGVWITSLGTGLGATNNTIKNCNISTGSTSVTTYGISVSGTSIGASGADNDNVTIQNNSITSSATAIYANGTAALSAGGNDNLLITQNTIVFNGTNAAYGIRVGNSITSEVSQNNIDLQSSSSSFAVGISAETGYVNSTILRNLLTRIFYTGTSGYGGRGITVGGQTASNLTIANNVIYGVGGDNYTSFGSSSSAGIMLGTIGNSSTISTTIGGVNLYYNSINMYGDFSRAANTITTALYIGSGASTLDIRNNVFRNSLNNTNVSGTGSKAYAIYSAVANTAFTNINYNSYFVSGTQGVLGFLTSDRVSLVDIQTGFGQNTNSISSDPQFNSNTNLIPDLSSTLLNAAITGTGITNDYINATRSVTTPSIGAYEAGGDFFGPIITYTNFTNGACTDNRTLSATITDGSGVNTTAGTKPRLYFKKSTDANTYVGNTNADNGWKYVEATNSSSPFSFTTDFTLLQAAVVGGDVIQYFVVAQDNQMTPLVSINSGVFNATPTSVALTAGAFPITGTINSYTVIAAVLTDITIGATGTYTTLTGASGLFADLNTKALSANTTVRIIDATIAETGANSLNQINYGCATYTLTIKPDVGVTTTLSGSATALINLNGADNVIIDGSNNGTSSKDMTITNTNTTGSTIRFINDATSNTVKNCILTAANTSTSHGIINISTGTTTGNDNNIIESNNLGSATNTVYCFRNSGSTSNTTIKNSGNQILSNNIFNFTNTGIRDEAGSVGALYSANNIYQTNTQTSGLIGFTPRSTSIEGFTFTRNRIYDMLTTSTSAIYGVQLWDIVGNSSIIGEVSNNMISIDNTTSLDVRGIHDNSAVGEYFNIYNNTVYLAGATSGVANSEAYYWGIASTSNVKNNIFINLKEGGTGKHYGIRFNATLANITSDNNNIYNGGGTASVFGNDGTADRTSLTAWQTATSKDANSINYNNSFTSVADLHLTNTNFNNYFTKAGGTPIAGITTDIDGGVRNATMPTIGADEVSLPGFWTGGTSTVWDGAVTGNWDDNTLPIGGSNIFIPNNVTNKPVITGINPMISNLYIGTANTLSLNGQILTITGAISGSGSFIGSSASNLSIGGSGAFGTINLDQTTDGTTNLLNNFTLNRSTSGTASFGNKTVIAGVLTLTDGALTTGGLLTLKSTSTTTARVDPVLGSITGNVTVERYLPSRRAWRLLTAPVTQTTPSSLNTTWKTLVDIVGPSGSNLTQTRPAYNFLTFDASTNAWVNVSDPTTVNLTGSSLNNAFCAFIPGPLGTAITDSANVTLTSTGALLTGTKTFNITAPTDNYALIPNPYASPVDLNAVYGASTGIYRTFYTWDPRQGGSIGTGGYITMSWNGASYDILGNGNATAQDLNVQSGQAFFVQASAPNPSIVFDEAHKSTTNINTVFGVGTGNVDNLRIGVQRIESGSPVLVGEVLTSYHNNYSKAVNFNDDAEKMWNNEENIAIRREGYNLSIERRPFIGGSNDSIFLGLSSLRANTNYSLSFSPSNWDAGSKAYLIDKLLSTETLIDLNSTNFVHQFTSTVATANDRFVVVFRGATLPNRGFTLGAEKLGTNKVKVNWEAQGEVGVREYALERSVDGVSYQVINTQQAKNNNTVSNYTYTDNSPMNGVNYYRVKTTQQNDVERYSSIVTINFKQQSSNPVTVYPNPVKGNQIGLQLQEIDKGLYSVRILSIEGKEVYKQQLQVSGTSLNTTISPTSKLASGTYTLQVVGKNNSYTQKIVVE